MVFFCDKCGKCCRLIGEIPQLAAFDRGDGVCIHLQGNLCNIYDHRPDICNVEKMFPIFSTQLRYSDYTDLMTKSCVYLKQNFEELLRNQKDKKTFQYNENEQE